MRTILFSLAALLCCLPSAFSQKPQAVPGELIVQVLAGRSIDHVVLSNSELNGQPTQLRVNRILSPQMRAYLLEFDPAINRNALQQSVFSHPSVSAVQFNHYVQDRAVPNDPQFNQQWQHINTGGNGGTADADVDSDLAWDITTGGVTAMGDTIVVCVVDDGISYNHPDLQDNLWFNHQEIPNNNQDDDGNGYVDDYYGWNPVNDNDAVGNGGHGINVAGMIGAKGNNGIGVVGVNWNVKIMTVTYGSIGSINNPNEANVIEAYTYPLTMRQLYEETGGEKGAFVVATNSSWGINNGNPANAPIWCAFYDTLGVYGILSAGATANAQINVDVNGDLPTACGSDYLLSVTATNNEDERTFSAYGLTTVDLGAPGEQVRTTSGSNGYTTTDGTSFASPMVAGAVALLYSAPCASLAAIAHADPALAAQLVKQYILDGVDVVNDLVGFTVTGGRLNLRGALDEVILNCSDAGCLEPLNVHMTDVIDTTAVANWTAVSGVLTVDLRYGVVGGDTVTVTGATAPYMFEGLAACTDYWVSLRAQCEEDSSSWGDDILFTTDGCCDPPTNVTVGSINDSTATVSWNAVLAAEGYLVEWLAAGESVWQQAEADDVVLTIGPLNACTEFEVRVATVCANDTTIFTPPTVFQTLGCGACTDLTYCDAEGEDVSYEWISNVTIDGISNNSGGQSGYSDFTGLEEAIELQRGATYSVSFTPGYAGFQFTEYFRLWIDLNHNGIFSASNEQLFDGSQGTTSTITGTITIPTNAQLGSARLRVSMTDINSYPNTSCTDVIYGEIEDYCVTIVEDSIINAVSDNGQVAALKVYPTPVSDVLNVTVHDAEVDAGTFTVRDVRGRELMQVPFSGSTAQQLNVEALDAGIYLIECRSAGRLVGQLRFIKR